MKLEVGKYYKTRDGRKVGPMQDRNLFGGSFLSSVGGSYYSDGSHVSKTGNDIIAEWTDAPEIGTLAEIGAKVGDVVEAVSYCGVVLCRFIIEQEDIDEMELENYRIVSRANRTELGLAIEDALTEVADIVSRDKSGPVITETVTRKRIMPGVYGKFVLTEGNAGTVAVKLNEVVGGYSLFTRSDLIAARDVFNHLIDALEE